LLQSPTISNLLRNHQQKVRDAKLKEIEEKRKAALNAPKEEDKEKEKPTKEPVAPSTTAAQPTEKGM